MPTIGTGRLAPSLVCLSAPLALLLAVACQNPARPTNSKRLAALPPTELFHTDKTLIDLREAIPGIHVGLPYATRRNVTHRRLYPEDMPPLLDRDTAAKLKIAQAEIARHGRALKVWDAYRPPEVQWELWRRSGRSGYVADPRLWWSKHCSGRAVDVTLVDPESGRELPMPSRFDDFSKRASSNYRGRNPEVRANLALLRGAMERAGFVGIEMEWWHYANARHYEKNIAPIPAADAGIDLSHLGEIKRF